MNNDEFVAYLKDKWPYTYKAARHCFEESENESNSDAEKTTDDMNVSPICLGAVFDDVRSKAAFMMELFGYHTDEDGERHSDYKPLDCVMGLAFALSALNNDFEALASLHSVDD